MNSDISECRLCPRNCGVDRTQGLKGYCGMSGEIRLARAALHMWEEPCISGVHGSGAVFFRDVHLDASTVRITALHWEI